MTDLERALLVGRDGLVTYHDDKLDRRVWLRMRQGEDGRWEVKEVYVPSSDRIVSTDDLRRIPLGRIEAVCNRPEFSADLAAKTGRKSLAIDYYARVGQLPPTTAATPAFGTQHSGTPTRADGKPLGKFPLPKSSPYPDEFYMFVATAYMTFTQENRHPARVIGMWAKVPDTTAHRWIKEARRRGFLPPGRRGKAG